MIRSPVVDRRKNGAACAAVLAAGMGSAVFGLAVVLAELSPTIKSMLNWWDPAGPLTGKTSVGVLAWLVAWAVLHVWWSRREKPFQKVWAASLMLLAIGFLFTFPPVFSAFAQH